MKPIFIIFIVIFFCNSCGYSNVNDYDKEVEEPVIVYHENYSTPLDTFKTFRYAVYTKNKELFLSCFTDETRKELKTFYDKDDNFDKVSRVAIFVDLNDIKIKKNYMEGKETSVSIIYEYNNMINEHILIEIDSKWLFE